MRVQVTVRPARKNARWGTNGTFNTMTGLLIGYGRVSTNEQDLTAQKNALATLGVTPEKTFTGQGFTGANRAQPGLREALAACRDGETLVVTKLDRLARSLRDAKDIVDELTRREVKLSIGGSVHDPTDPVGLLLSDVLAMVAEFKADLIRARTREGMAVAKAKGHLRGKQPKFCKTQEAHLVSVHRAGINVNKSRPYRYGLNLRLFR
jgi:DNA invertase Pin-like site-specific DNA recombinase